SDVSGTSELPEDTGGGMTGEPEPDVVAPPPFRLCPPNLMFTPAQSVSSWASRRTVEPGIWRIGPWIALRKPCIQASEAVTFSFTWKDAPMVSVLVMIPGAWALKSVTGLGIGLVL